MKNPRMNKKLKFWIDHAVATHRAANPKRIKLIMDVLAEFEAAGEAMRYRTRYGTIAWKATPQMLERLAEQEREARDDLDESI